MKKLFFVLLRSLMLVGCATQMPIAARVDFPQDSAKYRILGRVTLEAKASKSGYIKLLEEAKRVYPECDEPFLFRVRFNVRQCGYLKSFCVCSTLV